MFSPTCRRRTLINIFWSPGCDRNRKADVAKTHIYHPVKFLYQTRLNKKKSNVYLAGLPPSHIQDTILAPRPAKNARKHGGVHRRRPLRRFSPVSCKSDASDSCASAGLPPALHALGLCRTANTHVVHPSTQVIFGLICLPSDIVVQYSATTMRHYRVLGKGIKLFLVSDTLKISIDLTILTAGGRVALAHTGTPAACLTKNDGTHVYKDTEKPTYPGGLVDGIALWAESSGRHGPLNFRENKKSAQGG
jgi:hypothetical protein